MLELEGEWIAILAAEEVTFPFAPTDLVRAVNTLKLAYDDLFRNFTYTPEQMARYHALDTIRIALLEGKIERVRQYFGW